MTRPNRRLPLTVLLGFKDAAAELCVSTTTASNQIRRIERDWGVSADDPHDLRLAAFRDRSPTG